MAPSLRCLKPDLVVLDTRIACVPAKQADRFYLSKPWRDLMKQLLQSRGLRCEACGRSGTRIFGDHVHELKDGGAPLDPTNIRLLCGSCHKIKTDRARAARFRAG